jgi:anti-sigma B factor antagonist
MSTKSSLRMRRVGPVVTFQMEGRGTMQHSLPLRRAAEQACADGATTVHVDLHLCTYMDSTFLGTLLCLLRGAASRLGCTFALVAPSPACQQIVHQMGLEEMYPVCSVPPLDGPWTEVGARPEDAAAFNRNVVRAHKELANTSGPASGTFQRVVDCLAKDMPEDDEATLIITKKESK